nr:flagellar hook protein FlgE [uncultured Rhodoferax sp.]
MSFQTGLSGLNASSKSLDVIGNNISNANTVGMKSSRTEFSALVANQLGAAGGGSGPGIGVAVGTIAQQFTQGNVSITGNNLDVAVNGGGFFQLTMPDKSTAYTRDGQFKLDSSGNLITNGGANVMGYPTDLQGNRTSITPQAMNVPTNAPIPARATTAITAEFNLDSRTKPAIQSSPPTPISTYGTTMNAFDSQGNEVPVNLYFVKTGPDTTANPAITTDTWDVFDATTVAAGTAALNTNAATYATHVANVAYNSTTPPPVDKKPTFAAAGTGAFSGPQLTTVASGALFQLKYDANGKLTGPTGPQNLTLTSTNSAIGTFNTTLDISKSTQYGTSFAVSNLKQDGYTAGDLTGVTIDPSGVITTRYSNGETQARGQLLLADFRNVQGLTQIGASNWTESQASGQPVLGNPGLGKFGSLRSGALEDSNVDLTGELVNMMTAQRNYQANAQTIKTQDQVMSTLVNLR